MGGLSLSSGRIRAYIDTRLSEGAARATVQRELAVLRRMFRLGAQADKGLRVPQFPTLAVHNAWRGFFERDQFEKVLAELPDYLQPLATVAYWTGWRKGELLRLERRRNRSRRGNAAPRSRT